MRLARLGTLCFVVMWCLTGCFSTTLPGTSETAAASSITAERRRLQGLANSPLGLSLDVASYASSAAGYQYMFFALPVARVYTPHLKDDLTEALMLEGAFRSYNVQPTSPTRSISPHLTVTVTALTVSGYDLLAVRRPSASITLTGVLASLALPQRETRCVVSADATTTERFAFSAQLTNALTLALRDAAKKLFDCLLHYPSQPSPAFHPFEGA